MKKLISQYHNTFPDNYGLIVESMVTYNSCVVSFTNVVIFNILTIPQASYGQYQ